MIPLLEVNNVLRHFAAGRKILRAVDGVTFTIDKGETVGLVGESGCGKSTLGRVIVRLQKATRGRVVFDGEDVTYAHESALRRGFRRRVQMVFQDPYASLNPRWKIRDILAEPMHLHGMTPAVEPLLEMVGLQAVHADRYPHEFSGGQRQRIGLARALATKPDLVVADEPVSALDVSVQAQVVNLMRELQQQTGTAFLFISHDLAVVRHLSRRIMVMYLGKVVEEGTAADVIDHPAHPYTRALLEAVPEPEVLDEPVPMPVMHGELPAPTDLPSGCRFNPRCPFVIDICHRLEPALQEVRPGHLAACHRAGEVYQ